MRIGKEDMEVEEQNPAANPKYPKVLQSGKSAKNWVKESSEVKFHSRIRYYFNDSLIHTTF